MNGPRNFISTPIRTAAALLATLALVAVCSTGPLHAGELSDRVSEGVDFFKTGDYQSAAAAFDQAGVIDPDDPRVAFDRGCVYAVEGENEDAIAQFQKAAQAEDAQLAARAQYNLGCLDVARAEKFLGDDPIAAPVDARKQTVERLEAAIVYFRDALAAQADHADARFNLESVRLWLARMEEEWKNADLQAQLEQQELLDMIRKLDGSQRRLRAECKKLESARRSIFRRQEIFIKEQQQRELVMHIEPLKAKLAAAIGTPQATVDPGGPNGQSAGLPRFDPQEAIALLGGIADNSATAMNTAADRLAETKIGEAIDIQMQAVDQLDQIFMTVAPYHQLVEHAIEVQGRLADRSQAVVGPAETLESSDSAAPATSASEEESPRTTTVGTTDSAAAATTIDWADSATDQQFVARYTLAIGEKARQMLEQLPPPPEPTDDPPAEDELAPPPLPTDPYELLNPAVGADPSLAVPIAPLPVPGEEASNEPPGLLPDDTDPGRPLDPNAASGDDAAAATDDPVDPAEAARRKQQTQIEALREALTAAVNYCPDVMRMGDRSAQLLLEGNAADALPLQQEALRLLKEMLPKIPEQDEPDQKQQEPSSCNSNECDNPNSSSESDQPEDQQNQSESEQQDQENQNDDPRKGQQDDEQAQNTENEQQSQNEEDPQDPRQQQDEPSEDQQDESSQEPNQTEEEEQGESPDESQQDSDQLPLGELPDLEDGQTEQIRAKPGEPTDIERRKVEALLLRVRARQKERDRLEAFILEQQYRPSEVEKDW